MSPADITIFHCFVRESLLPRRFPNVEPSKQTFGKLWVYNRALAVARYECATLAVSIALAEARTT